MVIFATAYMEMAGRLLEGAEHYTPSLCFPA